MKLKYLTKKVLPVMLIAIAMLMTSMTSFAAADMAEVLTGTYGYKMHSEKLSVQKSKVFNIIFSKDVDSSTDAGVRIVEKDGSANVVVETSVAGPKHIQVSPTDELKVNSSYYLIIDSPEVDPSGAIASSGGEELGTGIVCEFLVQGEHIYDATAVGSLATSVSGKVIGADRVEVLYDGRTKEAILEDGAFSWNIFPGLEKGAQVTIKAYSGSKLLEELTIEA